METSSKTPEEVEKEKLEIVKTFSKKVLDKYKDMVKCIVLFGEHEVVSEIGRDIDVFIVLDDTQRELSSEELSKIEEDIDKMAEKVSDKLSVQPPSPLTEFWHHVRVAEPLIYNVIKTGRSVYDAGFFSPLQRLLNLGKIPLTREEIINLIEDAPKKIMRAEAVKLLMLAEDFYYAMLNSTQAVLMWLNVAPPPPTKAYQEVINHLVKTKLLEPEYAEWLKEIVEIRKKIERKELTDVSGQFVDEWLDKTKKYFEKMYALHSFLELRNKENIIKNSYEVMHTAARKALETLNKLPESDNEIPQVFRNEFIEKKLIGHHYYGIWQELTELKNLIDKGKVKDIDSLSYDKVIHLREEVRRMLHDLVQILRKKEGELGKIEEQPSPV